MEDHMMCPIYTAARKKPRHIAILENNEAITYKQLDERIDAFAVSLFERGVASQSRIAIVSHASSTYIALLWAAWRLGVMVFPFNPRFPSHSLANWIKNYRCAHVITEKDPLFSSSVFLKKPRISSVKKDYSLHQLATILLTSGSTGDPKLAAHTFGNYVWNAKGARDRMPLNESDRWLLTLPLYHVGGLSILFRVFLAQAALVIPPKKEPLNESLKKNGISHVSLVHTQLYRLLLHMPFPLMLKAALVGGSAIQDSMVIQAVQKGIPVFKTYGLTEMTSQVTCGFKKKNSKDVASSGTVLPYRDYSISETGEILVKGLPLFKGYLNKQNMIILPLDKNGWFETQDIGRKNKDGSLTVLGRRDHVFISGGENIQPEEIETYLLSFKGISEALVVPYPDPEFGFRPLAFMDCDPALSVTSDALRGFLEDRLPKYKIPIGFFYFPEESAFSSKQEAFNQFKIRRFQLSQWVKTNPFSGLKPLA